MTQTLAAVRALQIELRSQRDDAIRIDVLVAHVVMPLDVIEVHRLANTGRLVEIAHVAGKIQVVFDAAQVALEVAVVHGIETHERREQAPVRLGERIADEIP